MSEIQRYACALDESGTAMDPAAFTRAKMVEAPLSGEYVRFTDHEAERAENLATIDFLNKELRSAVDALADAEARIEGLVHKEQGFDNADMEYGYGRGLAESIRALAALTQPQAEQWHENDEADKAATAAGVADADPVARITKKVNESLGAELADACDHIRALIGGDVGAILYAREWLEEHDHEEREPGPYAKAFRERVCPVPEFPGIEKEEA